MVHACDWWSEYRSEGGVFQNEMMSLTVLMVGSSPSPRFQVHENDIIMAAKTQEIADRADGLIENTSNAEKAKQTTER